MMFDVPRAAIAAGILIFVWTLPVSGQQTSLAGQVQKAYGLDQDLVNGTQYYNRYLRAQGHPYFLEKTFFDGTLILNGREYPDVHLKYDIYSQQVEMEFTNFSGTRNHLVAVTDHVDGFILGDYRFSKFDSERGEKFCMVIRTEQFSCYIHWRKKLHPLSNDTYYFEQFTDVNPSFTLEMEGEALSFKSRRTFSGCFPESRQKEIRRLLRQKHFTFKNAIPDEIIRNMHAVSNLLNSEVFP